MKHKIKHVLKRRRQNEHEKIQEAAENAPRITNVTVAAHREEVLKSARKYILPLQHSKHQIVVITTSLFIAAVVAFFTYTTLALYKFQDSSTFMYHVTQVIPFPVARVDGHFVSYESYLFELRHYLHYYENQQKTDFSDPRNKDQLVDFRKRSLDAVINHAYVVELAKRNGVTVSDREISDAITTVRNQNRLGGSDKVFEDVLKDYWGWTVDDFRRSLRDEMLAQKVVAKLDTGTQARAQAALNELNSGADFAAVAKKYSDDAATKDNGGDLGYAVDRTDRNLSAQTTDALFKLKPGEHSGIINTGNSLEIVKCLEVSGDKVRAAHIVLNFKDINSYVNDLKDKEKSTAYIHV